MDYATALWLEGSISEQRSIRRDKNTASSSDAVFSLLTYNSQLSHPYMHPAYPTLGPGIHISQGAVNRIDPGGDEQLRRGSLTSSSGSGRTYTVCWMGQFYLTGERH
jgi:hypothetical protein